MYTLNYLGYSVLFGGKNGARHWVSSSSGCPSLPPSGL